MYRAAIGQHVALAGHRDADAIVRLLEALLLLIPTVSKAVREGLHDYLKLVWLHHGYNHHAPQIRSGDADAAHALGCCAPRGHLGARFAAEPEEVARVLQRRSSMRSRAVRPTSPQR
jgi:hypothetical protein